MYKHTLKRYIRQGLSSYKIAEKFKVTQTTVRYYLKKFNLKTKGCRNSNCRICNKLLTGNTRTHCSLYCRYRDPIRRLQIYRAQQNRGLKNKLAFIKMLGNKCKSCGYNKNVAALQFHHKNPKLKKLGLDIRVLSNNTLKKTLKELKKCELLCSNCHAEHHYPRFNNLIK